MPFVPFMSFLFRLLESQISVEVYPALLVAIRRPLIPTPRVHRG
jgi:hypothetical protein